MEKIQELENFVKENSDKAITQEIFTEFLTKYKTLLAGYLAGELTDIQLSNVTVYWYATIEEFSDKLKTFKPEVESLKEVMDITHPDFNEDKKKKIVENAIKKVEELLK